MTGDASFEDGQERPLNLGAFDVEDLRVLSALCQDAVFPISEKSWVPKSRMFVILVNRFRWEDARHKQHGPERVRALLMVDHVLAVSSLGIDLSDSDLVLSVLSVDFEAGEDAAGHVLITLAGDGAIRLTVEALEVSLKDVTRPYKAPSGKVPSHN